MMTLANFMICDNCTNQATRQPSETQSKRVSLVFQEQTTMLSTPTAGIQNEFDCLQIEESEHSESLLQTISTLNSAANHVAFTTSKNDDVSIVIGREHPHRFQNMSPAFLERFRFKCHDLNTASLRLLFGPDTDVPSIRSMLAAPSSPRTSGSLTLYRKDGEEVRCRIRVLPNDDNSTSTLIFDIEGGSCSSFSLPSEEPCASVGSSSSHGVWAPPAADSRLCSLLSEEPTTDPLVAIHIRAVRCAAAAAAAARPKRRAAGAQGE